MLGRSRSEGNMCSGNTGTFIATVFPIDISVVQHGRRSGKASGAQEQSQGSRDKKVGHTCATYDCRIPCKDQRKDQGLYEITICPGIGRRSVDGYGTRLDGIALYFSPFSNVQVYDVYSMIQKYIIHIGYKCRSEYP